MPSPLFQLGHGFDTQGARREDTAAGPWQHRRVRHDTSPGVGTARSPLTPLCATALTLVGRGEGRTAVVIGCAQGIEAIALLRLGWTVVGIDEDPGAHERIRAATDVTSFDRLTPVLGSLGQMTRLPAADMVLARSALLGDDGRAKWHLVVQALRPGGYLAARLSVGSAGLLRGWELLSERYTGTTLEVVARRP